MSVKKITKSLLCILICITMLFCMMVPSYAFIPALATPIISGGIGVILSTLTAMGIEIKSGSKVDLATSIYNDIIIDDPNGLGVAIQPESISIEFWQNSKYKAQIRKQNLSKLVAYIVAWFAKNAITVVQENQSKDFDYTRYEIPEGSTTTDVPIVITYPTHNVGSGWYSKLYSQTDGTFSFHSKVGVYEPYSVQFYGLCKFTKSGYYKIRVINNNVGDALKTSTAGNGWWITESKGYSAPQCYYSTDTVNFPDCFYAKSGASTYIRFNQIIEPDREYTLSLRVALEYVPYTSSSTNEKTVSGNISADIPAATTDKLAGYGDDDMVDIYIPLDPATGDYSATNDTLSNVLTDAGSTDVPVDPPAEGDLPDIPDMKLPDIISTKFPFSIPWDVYRCVNVLVASPSPPYFELPFKYERLGIDETIPIDLSRFDTLANICRWFTLIIFVAGLVMATRKLIGQ